MENEFIWKNLKDEIPKNEGAYFVIVPSSMKKISGKTPCIVTEAEWLNEGTEVWLESTKLYDKEIKHIDTLLRNNIINYKRIPKTGFYIKYCDYEKDYLGNVSETLEYLNDNNLIWAKIPDLPDEFLHPYDRALIDKKKRTKELTLKDNEVKKCIIQKTNSPKSNRLYKTICSDLNTNIHSNIEFGGVLLEITDFSLRKASLYIENLISLISKIREERVSFEMLYDFLNREIDSRLFNEKDEMVFRDLILLNFQEKERLYSFDELLKFTNKVYPYSVEETALQFVYAEHLMKASYGINHTLRLIEFNIPEELILCKKKVLFEYIYPLFNKIIGPTEDFSKWYGITWDGRPSKYEPPVEKKKSIKLLKKSIVM